MSPNPVPEPTAVPDPARAERVPAIPPPDVTPAPPAPVARPERTSSAPRWSPGTATYGRGIPSGDDVGVPDRVDPDALDGLESLAVEIVEHVGRVFRHEQRGGESAEDRGTALGVRTKSSEVDPVTRVDTEMEALIRRILADHRPGDAILGEEGGGALSPEGVTWIADPVDGTVNLLYGLPLSAVSLGVCVDGEFVAGAVHALGLGETYAARRGGGAWYRNGEEAWRPIGVSSCADLGRALVATGFSYDAEVRRQQGVTVAALLPRVRDIRRLGAAALDLCHVAAGRVDGYYERGIHVWDYAAGRVIAEEAGAVVEPPRHEGEPFLASAPGIARELAAAVRDERED